MNSMTIPSMILLTCALAGCGNGAQRNAATMKATEVVGVEVTKSRTELEQLKGSLTRLRDTAETDDLKTLVSGLKQDMAELNKSLASVVDSSESAISEGRKQSAEWHKEADTFTDASLRNASNTREGDLRDAVVALTTSNEGLKAAITHFNEQVSQILSALDLDFSHKGVQSIKPVIDKLSEDTNLQNSLTDVTEKSAQVSAVSNP